MFSNAQMQIMQPLIYQMRDQGYLYYIAYQNYLTSISDDYDLFIIFSKDEIMANNMYSYTIPSGSVKYSIRSGNASSNRQTQRILTNEIRTDISLSIEDYQHVSTNAIFSTAVIQPDLFSTEVKQVEAETGVLFFTIVLVFVIAFTKLFRR